MKTVFSRLLVAAVLAMAAWLSWHESIVARQVADARQAMATFDFNAAPGWTPRASIADLLSGPRMSDEIRVAKARSAYWLGRYEGIDDNTTDVDPNGEVWLAAANAAFRASQREQTAGPAAVQRLDGVLQAYASALKTSGRNPDAAYNYEFVARLRDQVARAPQSKTPSAAGKAGMIMAGDLPAGPTIHGGPGAPPPDAKMEELQTIAPMEYGDREAQPEPTPGAKRERKG